MPIDHEQPTLMSVLMHAAARREAIGYLEAANRMTKRSGAAFTRYDVGRIAGNLTNAILNIDKTAPPINMLVVRRADGLPGDGANPFIVKHLGGKNYDDLPNAQKRVVVKAVQDEVFDYNRWPEIAEKLFGKKPEQLEPEPPGECDGKLKRAGYGGPGESVEHLRLKKFVAENGHLFGAPLGAGPGQTEKILDSGDEIDVWFMVPDEQLAVEVKSVRSTDRDLHRGLYQCVKYKALLEAQLRVIGAKCTVRSLLVSERELSDDLKEKARLLDVRVSDPASRVVKP